MPKLKGVNSSKWWHFDRYQIVHPEGASNCIRPAQGAKLTRYDPWAAYQRARVVQQGTAPYESLVNLVRQIPDTEWGELHTIVAPEDAVEAGILDWCNRYGLLGIFAHNTLTLTLPPYWLPPVDDPAGRPYPTQLSYVRLGPTWREFRGDYSRELPLPSEPGPAGTPVPRGYAESAWQHLGYTSVWRQESVVAQGLYESTSEAAHFHPDNLSDYFPDLPMFEEAQTGESSKATRVPPFPSPLDPADFWLEYTEPIHEFLNAAWLLSSTLSVLATAKRHGTSGTDKSALVEALHNLHLLLAPVGPSVTVNEDGTFRQTIASISLLGSLAMMAVQDLTEDRLRECAGCGIFFTADRSDALYHSDQCRWRKQKQGQRKRQRTKARRRARQRKER